VRAEDVGRLAAERLTELISSRVPVDVHMADNLVPFAALVGGAVACEAVSDHVRSNIYVVEKFLPVKFAVDENTRTYSAHV